MPAAASASFLGALLIGHHGGGGFLAAQEEVGAVGVVVQPERQRKQAAQEDIAGKALAGGGGAGIFAGFALLFPLCRQGGAQLLENGCGVQLWRQVPEPIGKGHGAAAFLAQQVIHCSVAVAPYLENHERVHFETEHQAFAVRSGRALDDAGPLIGEGIDRAAVDAAFLEEDMKAQHQQEQE